MKELELRYVAHVTTVTNTLGERRQTESSTVRELIEELDALYPGFHEMFVDPETGQMQLNALAYYSDPGQVPISVIDLDQPVGDGGTVTFW
jgi:hypothetical protein